MDNPFRLHWLKGWSFQIIFLGGNVKIEAQGFGICLISDLLPGESPHEAADRLVLAEDRRRRALHNSWKSGKDLHQTPIKQPENKVSEKPRSLVVVD